jgi:hypothetical protein
MVGMKALTIIHTLFTTKASLTVFLQESISDGIFLEVAKK